MITASPIWRMVAAVNAAGVVFLEAFHYPYHALFQRVCALLDDQAVGEVEHISAILRMPAPSDSDPRWSAANMHLVDAAFAAGGIERPHHGSAVSIAKGHEVR